MKFTEKTIKRLEEIGLNYALIANNDAVYLHDAMSIVFVTDENAYDSRLRVVGREQNVRVEFSTSNLIGDTSFRNGIEPYIKLAEQAEKIIKENGK